MQIYTEKWQMVWPDGQDPGRSKIRRPQKRESGREAYENVSSMIVFAEEALSRLAG